jgi:chorismate mutase/prephenate dehydrogenase
MALVAEVAAYKRAHGLRVRDAARERELLDDRARRAAALGLPAAEIESVFRVLLRASRDRQAALRAEVPPGDRPRTVAVVGGRGGIGRVMVRCSPTSATGCSSPTSTPSCAPPTRRRPPT